MFLLDTVIISELRKKRPNVGVVRWVSKQFADQLADAHYGEHSRKSPRHATSATILTDLAQHAIVLAPVVAPLAPDPGDPLLWELLATRADLALVTGGKLLLQDVDVDGRVISPQAFVTGVWCNLVTHAPQPHDWKAEAQVGPINSDELYYKLI